MLYKFQFGKPAELQGPQPTIKFRDVPMSEMPVCRWVHSEMTWDVIRNLHWSVCKVDRWILKGKALHRSVLGFMHFFSMKSLFQVKISLFDSDFGPKDQEMWGGSTGGNIFANTVVCKALSEIRVDVTSGHIFNIRGAIHDGHRVEASDSFTGSEGYIGAGNPPVTCILGKLRL